MQSPAFWKSWHSEYKRTFYVIAAMFLLAILLAIVSFVRNPAPVFTWQQLQELFVQELPWHSMDVAGFEITIPAENYVVFERWMGNPLELSLLPLDLYLLLFSLSMIVLLAVITVLPRFWFFIGGATTIFLISSMRWESLEIPGFENKIPAAIVLIFILGICVFYQYFRTVASFKERMTAFFLAFSILGLLIFKFSGVSDPFRYFAIHTFPVSISFLLLFIILVAHEMGASFVALSSQGAKPSRITRTYFLLTAAYMLNLWLAYWDRIGWLNWDYTVPSFLLLAVSGILAVWGIRQREPLYNTIFPDSMFAVYSILALGSATFALTGYYFASANDISILSLNDLIIYAHLGYGLMFFMYVVANFFGMMMKDIPFHKVLYKPLYMPYFSYRFAGLIVTLAFLFYNTWMVPLNHFISGYYTALGDVALDEQDEMMSAGYFQRAHFYAPYNQHAATALSEWGAARQNGTKQRQYAMDANRFKPTEFTLVNASYLSFLSEQGLEELRALRLAYRQLPKSGVIQNNLGLSFARLGVIDSATFYFSKARKTTMTEASAEMNLLGLAARNNLHFREDSLLILLASDDPRVKCNGFALANRLGKKIETPINLPLDSTLNLFSASLIGNYLTNHSLNADTSFLAACVKIARRRDNLPFKETILEPVANGYYASGMINRAFGILQELVIEGSNPGKHNTTLALWTLDQKKPDVALTHFSNALTYQSPIASIPHAIALAEAGRLDDAILAWDSIGKRRDSSFYHTAESMKRILGGPPEWFNTFTENEKCRFILYRIPWEDSLRTNALTKSIKDEDLQARVFLGRAKRCFDLNEMTSAWKYFRKLEGLHLTEQRIFVDVKYFELRLQASSGLLPRVEEQMKKGILFGPFRETESRYYTAMAQAHDGDVINAAKNFTWLAANNPYFDEGIVAAAAFVQKDQDGLRKAYTILAEALQVNPGSVKILQAYILAAIARGFDQYAAGALETLKERIGRNAFEKYVRENSLAPLMEGIE